MPTQNFDTTYTLPHANCSEADFYQLCRTLLPTAAFVDGTSIKRDGTTGQLSAGTFTPTFKKFTKTFSDLSFAGLNNDIELFLLPAGGAVHAVKLKHSVAFSGGAIASYLVSVGISSILDKYLWYYDVKAPVTATNYTMLWTPFFNYLYPTVAAGAAYSQANLQAVIAALQGLWAPPGGLPPGTESHTSPTSIRLSAKTTGANLSVATTGSVDVWVMYTTLI